MIFQKHHFETRLKTSFSIFCQVKPLKTKARRLFAGLYLFLNDRPSAFILTFFKSNRSTVQIPIGRKKQRFCKISGNTSGKILFFRGKL
jgi:hypothetical protein